MTEDCWRLAFERELDARMRLAAKVRELEAENTRLRAALERARRQEVRA